VNTGLYIASRYLFARKSHNVINIISAISAVGMAVGTAALILILSIYNGFDGIIEDNMSDLTPELLVSRKTGELFTFDEELSRRIESSSSDVASVSGVLSSRVFLSYNGGGSIATAMGIDPSLVAVHPLSSHITSGEFTLLKGDVPCACIGMGLARELGINPRFVEKIELLYPRSGEASVLPLLGVASSLQRVSLVPKGIFSINSESDGMVFLPIGSLRTLLGANEGEVSGVEIRLRSSDDGASVRALRKELLSTLGEDFSVSDRYMQHPSIYKMMRYEKLAIYLILIFVVLTISVNIFGSLSMLIIDKKGDMQTLRAMGAGEGLIRRIFLFEGWLISLLGLLSGLIIGVALALLQQHLGLLKMPGGMIVSAYPCILQWGDVALAAFGVALIGLAVSYFASRIKS